MRRQQGSRGRPGWGKLGSAKPGSRKHEIVRLQRGERYVLQGRDDIRAVGNDHVTSRLRDVTVRQRLIEAVIRKAGKADHVALRAGAVDLEVLDHVMSVTARVEVERERVIAGAAHQDLVAGA